MSGYFFFAGTLSRTLLENFLKEVFKTFKNFYTARKV